MTKINELFKQDVKVINMGVKSFYEELKSQKVETIHVDWKPPAGGNPKMMTLLHKLRNK